jgi:hypothetical protein
MPPVFIDEDPADLENKPRGPIAKLGLFLGGVAVLGSFGVWGYAYSGQADRRTPDLLDEPAFALAAGPICDATQEEFESMPRALDAADNIERAGQIRAPNELFTVMINDLEAASTGTPRDHQIIGDWLEDWRTYVGHRADYADRFELDETERFYVSSVGGERLEKRIPRFADTNEIYSCGPPNDIG